MLQPRTGAKVLATCAAAAALVLAVPFAASAQSTATCDGYARDMAARATPGQGVIGSVVGVVEGALTLGASYEARWRAAYEAAFDDCMDSATAALGTTAPSVAVVEPETEISVVEPEAEVEVVEPAPQVEVVEPEGSVALAQPEPSVEVATPLPSRRVAVMTVPEPWTPAWYSYCAAKYRSFDPRTGQFLSYSGDYRFCR
jgi:hypothetical protein